MRKKERLDALLVERGLLPDLRRAQGWILAGKVLLNGHVADKPGTKVGPDDRVSLREAPEKYASRGGLKLERALAAFGVEARDRVVLDAGASTGGFTDCWLQHGARKVYAADVGYGQLKGSLAADPRVVSLERTNVSELSRASFDPPIELASFDLSYLSSVKAAPILRALFPPGARVEILGLIKPMYEGLAQEAMQDPAAIALALGGVIDGLAREGLELSGLVASPILGSRGAVELLAHLVEGTRARHELVPAAIAELGALLHLAR